jgi:nucleoside-diphosphate-sugar epimerase
MKVIVAGATGFAGSAVLPALVADGHEVTAAVRSPEGAERVREWGAAALEVDLFDPASVERVVPSHDVVCNLSTHIPSLYRAALPGAWRENDRIRREVSANLVSAALKADCGRFIQESIGFLYPDRGDAWIDENVAPDPTVVTRSALDAETNVNRFREAGRVGVTLRFAQFYGPTSMHSLDTVRLAARFHIGPLLGDPNGFSSWIHHDDIGSAVLTALRAPSGTFNVGDDQPMRRRELHLLFAEALGVKRQRDVGRLAARLGGQKAQAIARSQRLSNASFVGATGWTPQVRSARDGWPAILALTEARVRK